MCRESHVQLLFCALCCFEIKVFFDFTAADKDKALPIGRAGQKE